MIIQKIVHINKSQRYLFSGYQREVTTHKRFHFTCKQRQILVKWWFLSVPDSQYSVLSDGDYDAFLYTHNLQHPTGVRQHQIDLLLLERPTSHLSTNKEMYHQLFQIYPSILMPYGTFLLRLISVHNILAF